MEMPDQGRAFFLGCGGRARYFFAMEAGRFFLFVAEAGRVHFFAMEAGRVYFFAAEAPAHSLTRPSCEDAAVTKKPPQQKKQKPGSQVCCVNHLALGPKVPPIPSRKCGSAYHVAPHLPDAARA